MYVFCQLISTISSRITGNSFSSEVAHLFFHLFFTLKKGPTYSIHNNQPGSGFLFHSSTLTFFVGSDDLRSFQLQQLKQFVEMVSVKKGIELTVSALNIKFLVNSTSNPNENFFLMFKYQHWAFLIDELMTHLIRLLRFTFLVF